MKDKKNRKREKKEKERLDKKVWKIATWNIRSITGKERELITEFEQANLDILGITETKKKKQGIMEMKGEHVLIYSGCKQKHEGKIRSGMHCQERA